MYEIKMPKMGLTMETGTIVKWIKKEGDLVATGTPAGVGIFMKNKKLLRPGDEVICEIEKIGRLANKVASP